MHPLVVRPGRLMEMDLESSEDRWMILVLMAISPSSLVLTTLGIVFGSLIYFIFIFLQSPKYAHFTGTEETPVDFKTTFPFDLLFLLGRYGCQDCLHLPHG